MTIVCPSCRTESPDGFRFCPECAAPLAAPRTLAEERKIVTTLFCDLVGFTAASEKADPEDVDAALRSYHAAARRVIEVHGGTIEKFIGDAVVAVFGVPAAHEDDPERAVRAGLRLAREAEQMTGIGGAPLRLRVGIDTGEVLVRLDVDPASGRGFITGDAVNTAARLQAAAPPMGVVVGESTHSLTVKAIDYEELEPIAAKGKAEPVAAWLALAPRARTGVDSTRAGLTPLVGRQAEVDFLTDLFGKAAGSSPQVVLIIGEPGIGKSRLVTELYAHVDQRPGLTTWRQGRCVPYGEVVAFGALGEIVKAHAGILETDDLATLEARLDGVLPPGPDQEWFRQRLRPLLGLEAPRAQRDENFTAWLRFLEHVAAAGPIVLVFEDLQWADEALLIFLEYLSTNAHDVPLLLVATARPELFEKHPAFAAASRGNRLVLEPLTAPETRELVTGLLVAEAVDEKIVAGIVERSAGNPFYAEESARLVGDTGAPALPASVQAVISARLDALPADEKAVLADASVAGGTFWSGAVAVLGGHSANDVETALDDLVARRLVHPVRDTSMAGEKEYAFRHALAREVAYQQLPRAARARKHAALARWIEEKAGERRDDLAELLGHHYLEGLGLARAAGEAELAGSLLDPAVHYLALAGRRALPLDVAAAERHYRRLLELTPEDHHERPRILLGWGVVLELRDHLREAAAMLERASDGLRAQGDRRGAAEAMARLAGCLANLGKSAGDLPREALELLGTDGPSEEKMLVLSNFAAWNYVCGRSDLEAVIDSATRALAVGEELGLPTPVIALGFRGMARLDLGDLGGLDDYREALEAAERLGLADDLALLQINYGSVVGCLSGPPAARKVFENGQRFAQQHGLDFYLLSYRAILLDTLRQAGGWDEALALLPDVEETLAQTEDLWTLLEVRAQRVLLLALRGDAVAAAPHLGWVREKGAETDVTQHKASCLLCVAFAEARLGHRAAAVDLLEQRAALPLSVGEPSLVTNHTEAVRTALACGDAALAGRLADSLRPILPLHKHAAASANALLAEACGEAAEAAAAFAAAASAWHDFGVPYEEGQALLGEGRCLLALDRAPEAAPALSAAREIFSRLGAKPALTETEALLAETVPDSS